MFAGADSFNSSSEGNFFYEKIGRSTFIQSGIGENNTIYYKEKQIATDGNTKNRTIKFYDPEDKVIHEKKYQLNLTDPDAEEILVSKSK